MKRAYELMVLVRSDFPDSDSKKDEVVKKLLGDHGTVKKVISLGKKQLSYPIQKQTDAVYLLATIEADGIKVGEVEKRAKVQDEILRFLLTVQE